MTKDNTKKEVDQDQKREILSGQKFSLSGAIGREAGKLIKGESPIPRLQQIVIEIHLFISKQLHDPSGALREVLHILVKEDEVKISSHLESPLVYLKEMLDTYINNDQLLYELVREVDFKYGQIFNELPHFQKEGEAPHRDDEYTHESVRKQLLDLISSIKTSGK